MILFGLMALNTIYSLTTPKVISQVLFLELQASKNNRLSDVHFDLVSRTKLLMFLPTKLSLPTMASSQELVTQIF